MVVFIEDNVSNSSYLSFPPLLANNKIKAGYSFLNSILSISDKLSPERLALFKQALALSDFILRSALQAPELVVELFGSERLFCTDTPDYNALLSEELEQCKTEEQLHQCLRLFRLVEMVHIAVGDFLLGMTLDESLKRLSSIS